MKPSIILINPWIYDFAAFDLWSKPLGLLQIAAFLRDHGFSVRLIDCLDVHHPLMKAGDNGKKPRRDACGTGKFWKKTIPSPPPIQHIARPYNRYGTAPSLFEEDLRRCEKPSAILVTSLMTYWYPGVREAIRTAKAVYPDVPVILGGIYATLCHRHAVESSGADRVIAGDGMDVLLKTLEAYGIPIPAETPPERPSPPAFDLQTKIEYICIMTSKGCPFQCAYCACRYLNPQFVQRDPEEVLDEILAWHTDFGVRDFAFYDDALLINAETHAGVLLEKLLNMGLDLRFHTPNAMHVKNITPEIARLLYQTGFRTIRLGLETLDMAFHRNFDHKMQEGDFENAVRNLRTAGYSSREIGTYILMGLPDQSPESVAETIHLVGSLGASPCLSEYSPIPHTALWEKAVAASGYDLAREPLFHNNTLLSCWNEPMQREAGVLKRMAFEIRRQFVQNRA